MKSPNRKQKLIKAINEGNKEKLERLIECPEKPYKNFYLEFYRQEGKVLYEGKEIGQEALIEMLDRDSKVNEVILKIMVFGNDNGQSWKYLDMIEDYPAKGIFIVK